MHGRNVWLALATIAAAALVLSFVATKFGLGPPIRAAQNGGVARVELRPVPEGPSAAFELTETGVPAGARSLALIHRYIPEPLPPQLFQWFCNQGADLEITFGNSRQLIYGPCNRPASIDRLWAESMFVDTDGRCAPRCGPGGSPGP